MERFAFPRLGKLPVSEVTSADVVEALRKVWHERPATARRVRQRISTVMEWAVALNYRDDNPCSRIGPVLGPQQDLVQHVPALPHRDVAAVVETVRASGAAPVVKLAFEFLVLTAARSGEVRGAEWTEIDTEEHIWTVPATRTKAKREHRVPLSGPALAILDAGRSLANGNPLVFPSVRGKRMNDMVLSGLLKTLEVPAVPHGFRSTFRDWATEETAPELTPEVPHQRGKQAGAPSGPRPATDTRVRRTSPGCGTRRAPTQPATRRASATILQRAMCRVTVPALTSRTRGCWPSSHAPTRAESRRPWRHGFDDPVGPGFSDSAQRHGPSGLPAASADG